MPPSSPHRHASGALTAAAVAASARALAAAIASLRTDHIRAIPGWTVEQPSIDELAEIQSFALARSRPDQLDAPYRLPVESDTYVSVVEGAALVSRDGAPSILVEQNGSCFAERGSRWSLLAQHHPTVVLCVSYREVKADDTAGSRPAVGTRA
ncbi:MAG: hypothetical protein JO079_00435 [Frankiaceae bacterium]|nr:hypothetical protein [Frankiaceae bacterium]